MKRNTEKSKAPQTISSFFSKKAKISEVEELKQSLPEFSIIDVPGNGCCLFAAIGLQLNQSSATVRENLVCYLATNVNEILPHSEQNSSFQEYGGLANYITAMKTKGTYGDSSHCSHKIVPEADYYLFLRWFHNTFC